MTKPHLFSFFLRKDFLFICFKSTLYLPYILARRQGFRPNATIKKHVAYSTIILNMFTLNTYMSAKILMLYIYRCHFCRKILGFYSYR